MEIVFACYAREPVFNPRDILNCFSLLMDNVVGKNCTISDQWCSITLFSETVPSQAIKKQKVMHEDVG